MYNQTITILRAVTTEDRYGDGGPDWSQPTTRTDVPNVMVQPTATTEQQTEPVRVPTIDGYWICTRPGDEIPDVTELDRIEYLGTAYEVVGKPTPWPDPVTGRPHHLEVTVTRVRR